MDVGKTFYKSIFVLSLEQIIKNIESTKGQMQ